MKTQPALLYKIFSLSDRTTTSAEHSSVCTVTYQYVYFNWNIFESHYQPRHIFHGTVPE